MLNLLHGAHVESIHKSYDIPENRYQGKSYAGEERSRRRRERERARCMRNSTCVRSIARLITRRLSCEEKEKEKKNPRLSGANFDSPEAKRKGGDVRFNAGSKGQNHDISIELSIDSGLPLPPLTIAPLPPPLPPFCIHTSLQPSTFVPLHGGLVWGLSKDKRAYEP